MTVRRRVPSTRPSTTVASNSLVELLPQSTTATRRPDTERSISAKRSPQLPTHRLAPARPHPQLPTHRLALARPHPQLPTHRLALARPHPRAPGPTQGAGPGMGSICSATHAPIGLS